MKILKTAILASLLSVSCNSFAGLNTGLVAYWSFDDCTANDKSGKGNNGTINGNLSCITGVTNKALQFDGASYITVPSSPSLNPINQWTMSFWIRIDDLTNLWSTVIHKGGVGTDCGKNREYVIFLHQTAYFHIVSAGDNSCHHVLNTVGNSIIKGQWLHYVAVIDRLNHVTKEYINGQLKNQQTDSYSSFNNNNANLRIGSSEEVDNSLATFKGALDEIRLHNRVLTDAEVSALYQQGTKTIKNGVSSNTDICKTNSQWCVHPTFTVFGVTKESDIPINLINTSYIVDGFNRNVSGGKVNITANFYNRGYADAMLDIYDKQGNWTNFIRLDGNRPETSIVGDIWDKWTTTYDSYNDEYSTFDPRDAGSSKKLNVGFSIPNGGYAVLSKNSKTAIGNMVLNTALTIFDEPKWIAEKGNAKKKLVSIFANAAINEGLVTLAEQLKKAVENNNQAEASSITIEMTQKLSKITYKAFKENATEVINIIGDKAAQRFAKKAVKFFSPLGQLIGAAETVADELSITGQWIDIAKANNNRAVYFK